MSKKMNKKELIGAMALRNGTTKVQAAKELSNVLGTLLDLTADLKEVQLLGDFSTEIRDVESRDYPNPQDRTQIVTVDAHKKVVIKAGSKFQAAVNGDAFEADAD